MGLETRRPSGIRDLRLPMETAGLRGAADRREILLLEMLCFLVLEILGCTPGAGRPGRAWRARHSTDLLSMCKWGRELIREWDPTLLS